MIGKAGGAKVVRKGRKKGSAQTVYPKIHKCFIRHLKVRMVMMKVGGSTRKENKMWKAEFPHFYVKVSSRTILFTSLTLLSALGPGFSTQQQWQQ